MNHIKISKYLQRINRCDGVAVYHSLFGNLALLDTQGSMVLDFFENGAVASDAIKAFVLHDKIEVLQYINRLLQLRFLIPTGIDEYALIESDRNNKKNRLASGYLVRAMQLVLSNACNLSCSYCFTKNIYGSNERASLQCNPANMKMEFSVIKNAMDALLALAKKNGHTEVFIEFFGGEPLMNGDSIMETLTVYGNGPHSGVFIRYSITTNGTLLNIEMAKIFAKYKVTVTVSIDALSIKRFQSNQTNRILQNIKLLRQEKNLITINSVISRQTIEDYCGRSLIDYAAKNGITMIGLILELDPEFYASGENTDKACSILWDTWKHGREMDVPVVGYWHQIYSQIIGKQPLSLVTGYKTCPATGCKLSIEPAGKIFACKCCSEEIGSVTDMEAVFNTPQYEEYALKAYRATPACEFCAIEGFCDGICMGTLERKRENMDTDIHPEGNSSCELYRNITTKLIEGTHAHEMQQLFLGEKLNVLAVA